MIATVNELASYLQRDLTSDLQVLDAAELLLGLAEAQILDVVGGRTPLPAAAKAVQLEAAARVLRNPEGLRTQSVGGFQAGYDTARLGVTLTAEDVARLQPAPAPIAPGDVFLVPASR